MPTSLTRDALKAPQSQASGSGDLPLLTNPSALLRERFLTELACYETDKSYLTADKCAARCQWLSQLLTAAICAAEESDDDAWVAKVLNLSP